MKILIKSSNLSLTNALHSHAERRLRFALTFCDAYVQRIIMRLSDINGPRGGVDKCCRVQVVLEGLPDVVVSDIEADLYVAIDRAANRAGRTVRRRLTRQSDRSFRASLRNVVSSDD